MDKMNSNFSATVCEEAARSPATGPVHFRLDARQQAAEPKTSVTGNLKSLFLGPLYWLYQRRLLRQIDGGPLPRHVGIILDGNRRHARRHGLSDPHEIYLRGAEKLDGILDWCAALGIPAVTLWVFSTENLKRSPIEVSGILTAIESKLTALAQHPFIHRQRVRVRAIGRLEILPTALIAAIRSAEAATAQYNSMSLTIAVGYGGREEIVDAVRSFLKARADEGASLPDISESVTPDILSRHLYTGDLADPDLIIRTSGEIRLSGFLLWQSAYSELYFTDVNWPAFRMIDFLRAVREFQQRRRRFGG